MLKKKRLFVILGLFLFLFIISFTGYIRHPGAHLPLRNIEAFTRLYGYVRYFYPGDGAANMNWENFAIYGVQKVEQAQDRKELKKNLEELFLPIAPGIVIHDSNQKTNFSTASITPPDTTGKKVISWQHRGWGFSPKKNAYKSIRLNRLEKHPGAKDALFPGKVKFGEYIAKPLGCGLSCIVPLALYGTGKTTYPAVDQKEYQALKAAVKQAAPVQFSGNDLYVRLADIVICWNVFRHFYPYFDAAKTDWPASLPTALQSAYENKDKKDFLKTLKKLTAGLKDGHVRVKLLEDRYRIYCPPINWEWIEDRLIITGIYDDALYRLQAGDIVSEVDGIKSVEAVEKAGEYISAATPGYSRCRTLDELLRGVQGSRIKLKIERGVETFSVTVNRSLELRDYLKMVEDNSQKSQKVKEGIYYLNAARLSKAGFEELLPELDASKSIIFDLRRYPGTVDFLEYLLREDDTASKWMLIPHLIYPDYQDVTYGEWGWGLRARKPRLTGKIIFIINPRTISAGESVMSFVEHYELGTIIGQPTAGTNGNVNILLLPGEYSVRWTGMKVVKLDGSQHHGVGTIPHVFLERTVKGVREGRDEFLEKAIEIAAPTRVGRRLGHHVARDLGADGD